MRPLTNNRNCYLARSLDLERKRRDVYKTRVYSQLRLSSLFGTGTGFLY